MSAVYLQNAAAPGAKENPIQVSDNSSDDDDPPNLVNLVPDSDPMVSSDSSDYTPKDLKEACVFRCLFRRSLSSIGPPMTRRGLRRDKHFMQGYFGSDNDAERHRQEFAKTKLGKKVMKELGNSTKAGKFSIEAITRQFQKKLESAIEQVTTDYPGCKQDLEIAAMLSDEDDKYFVSQCRDDDRRRRQQTLRH
ncbi:hypothetical protein CYMTET_4392 [Cymbomonas tetramitiformis]|uniref:Uncharacterized protein n=1 Tax=Cymbomonas tetramitiformis TaxID=36881 RepID=A0AAE0H1A5_9CHLO|nr:hypothetical protein CYMTET_4392 [Cymbomonas tetramitiformis]